MNHKEVERQARLVQFEIWQKRERLFPLGVPAPQALFEPEIAARALGLEYHCHSPLGRFGFGGDRYEVAGMLDRERGVIAVSTRYDYPIRRFTGAHEVGNFVMQARSCIETAQYSTRMAVLAPCRSRKLITSLRASWRHANW